MLVDDGGVDVLVLEGVDTYGRVKVNGKVLLEVGNAFVEHRVVLKREDVRYDGENLLEVELTPTRGH